MKTQPPDAPRQTRGSVFRNASMSAIATACCLVLAASAANAAYDGPTTVRIENVRAIPRDAKTATISFDISWKASWRHEVNHDAAWVFFKVRPEGAAQWQPVRLSADSVLNPRGYGQADGTPLDFIVPGGPDGFVGMFVRRGEFGQGELKATGVMALWDITTNRGVTRDVKAQVRGFAIEMVYVPEGPFYLGLGGVDAGAFYRFADGSGDRQPYRVTGSGAIPTGRQAGKLWSGGKGVQPEEGGEIPATFPNGYSAFYCMKRVMKGVEYAGFLNTLPPAMAEARYPELKPGPRPAEGRPNSTFSRANGSFVKREGQPPNHTYTAGLYYISNLSWEDAATWAAWAGLRPMTELEYEKASRGPRGPGWDMGFGLQYNSYWGMQEFNGWKTGNEHPVTVANAKGRSFKGTHGRGVPQLPADWPQEDAVGAGTRGGWEYRNPSCRLAAATMYPERYYVWRGVRTAPREAREQSAVNEENKR